MDRVAALLPAAAATCRVHGVDRSGRGGQPSAEAGCHRRGHTIDWVGGWGGAAPLWVLGIQ